MLSIIIPVLNEADSILSFLEHLTNSISKDTTVEIILVDGGSNDDTEKLIRGFIQDLKYPLYGFSSALQVRFLNSEKGRAKQMNLGAKNANGEILYFLHADSFPPKNFDKHILNEVEQGNPAGCFRMKFDSNHWWLYLAGWFTKFNLKSFRGGDQSQFITKSLFEEIGGFDERYIIYEDNILISELYKGEKFVVIQQSLTTSARRYREHGVWRLQYHFWMIHLKRRLGADAEELYAYYSRHISNKSLNSLHKKPQRF